MRLWTVAKDALMCEGDCTETTEELLAIAQGLANKLGCVAEEPARYTTLRAFFVRLIPKD